MLLIIEEDLIICIMKIILPTKMILQKIIILGKNILKSKKYHIIWHHSKYGAKIDELTNKALAFDENLPVQTDEAIKVKDEKN